jgi:hypothetical protein
VTPLLLFRVGNETGMGCEGVAGGEFPLGVKQPGASCLRIAGRSSPGKVSGVGEGKRRDLLSEGLGTKVEGDNPGTTIWPLKNAQTISTAACSACALL